MSVLDLWRAPLKSHRTFEADMQTFTRKQLLFAVIVAITLAVILRMFGLTKNVSFMVLRSEQSKQLK
jgi:hypothetical protein